MVQLKAHARPINISVNRMGPVWNVPMMHNVLSSAINVSMEFVFVGAYQAHVIHLAVISVTQTMVMASACVVKMPSAT